jgi:hypothetical protein
MTYRLLVVLAALTLGVAAQAQSTLERLRDQVRETIRAAGEEVPPLLRLEQAAADVESVVGRVERHVDSSIAFLRAIGPCEGTPTAIEPVVGTPREELQRIPGDVERAFDELRAAHEEARKTLTPQRPATFRESLNRLLATSDDILTRQRDTSVAARWLVRFSEERRRSATHQELCRIADHLAPLPEPFTLADLRRDPLVPLRRVRESADRHVTRQATALGRGEWSLGLGFIWTPVDAVEDGREVTRAGQPVAMLAFRPHREDMPFLRNAPIRPWIQLGAGLRFEHPSFYVGGTVDLGPYAHFGVGWTAQQTERDGGEEFDGGVYLAVTVRLDRMRDWMH